MKRANQRGFTLIELLVVIAIISILATILIPSLKNAKEMAMRINCTSTVRSLSSGVFMYATENCDQLPPAAPIPSYQMIWPLASIINVADYMDALLVEKDSSVWTSGAYGAWYAEKYFDSRAFVCPATTAKMYGYSSTSRVACGYDLLTLQEPASYLSAYLIEPRSTLTQEKSVYSSKPLSDVLISEKACYNLPGVWVGNHVNGIKGDGNTSNLPSGAGANTLFKDGHVEWREGSDLVRYGSFWNSVRSQCYY